MCLAQTVRTQSWNRVVSCVWLFFIGLVSFARDLIKINIVDGLLYWGGFVFITTSFLLQGFNKLKEETFLTLWSSCEQQILSQSPINSCIIDSLKFMWPQTHFYCSFKCMYGLRGNFVRLAFLLVLIKGGSEVSQKEGEWHKTNGLRQTRKEVCLFIELQWLVY